MKKICRKEDCTGCSLCAARCPVKCILMEEDAFGHLHPQIDQTKCIDCGLCVKGCPAIHTIEANYPLKAFAGWSKDTVDYQSSSSGGAASVLSQHIIAEGGVVYGCSFQPGIHIKHIRVDKIEDLSKLKGSKYVQSNIEDSISLLKKDVKDKRPVLFIGTPCQVAAIKQMYKEQPSNLWLVDLICHGVPSEQILTKFITEHWNINKEDVLSVDFRDDAGFHLIVTLKDGTKLRTTNIWTKRYYDDLYINSFIDGFTYRESCYTCHYAKPERISDITIGDFWGLGQNISADEIPIHKHGISCLLPNTEHGDQLISELNGKMYLYKRTAEEAISGNDQLRAPKPINWRIKVFRKLNESLGFSFRRYQMLTVDKMLYHYMRKEIVKLLTNVKNGH